MTLSKIAPTEICTEDLKGRRLPENFESFCLISFHGSITRDERKLVLDCLMFADWQYCNDWSI